MIDVGSTLPEVTFGLMKDGKMTSPHTNELFRNQMVAKPKRSYKFPQMLYSKMLTCFF